MRVFLTCALERYDEDRWPSGTAGGKVIKDNSDFKAKHVLFTPNKYTEQRSKTKRGFNIRTSLTMLQRLRFGSSEQEVVGYLRSSIG